jgi:hypothetical protein
MNDAVEFQCKNYELCETNTISHNFLCKKCVKWGEIQIIQQKTKQYCFMCNELVMFKMLFPTNCGHTYCIDCTRYMLFCHETSMFNISPEPYGCPPCPIGCRNPTIGNQCMCPSYDEVIEEWWNENKEKAEEFSYACYLDGKHKNKILKCLLCEEAKNYTIPTVLFNIFILYPRYISKYLIEN